MKKNNFMLIVFLFVGLLTGSIAAHLLSSVEALSFLTKSSQISWEPKADLDIVKYDLSIQVKLNLASLLGLIAAFWLYRKI